MSITLPVLTNFQLTWTLTDSGGISINNAAVVASLYAGRSRTNPDGVPGTIVPPINALALPYLVGTEGQYSAPVPGTLDPPLDGTGYILVINATISGIQVYHSENPAVVETAGSKLDLTSVDQFKEWNPGFPPGTPNPDDSVIQAMITAWSFEFLRRTGQGDQGGDFTQSPFTAVCTWDEAYDGCGTNTIMLRNRPVKKINSLLVNGIGVPQSSGYPVAGFLIGANKRSVILQGGFTGPGFTQNLWMNGPYRALARSGFPYGTQNVSINYDAGFAVTPADIVLTANQVVQVNYVRRAHSDEEMRAIAGGGGTIKWRDWDIPPGAQWVIDSYSRTL